MSSRHYTGEHPPASAPDATQVSKGQPSPSPSPAAKLASLKMRLRSAIRQFPDFPEKGILFEDILPIFADPQLHSDLIEALELLVTQTYSDENRPDVVVGLEARGFLFAPSLALRLNAGFCPVRKKSKLPGPVVQVAYEKEYGKDIFEMQSDAIKPGSKVLIVDDILATGGTAYAAGELVQKQGGRNLGYLMLLELGFLHGRDKLDAPVHTLLSGQD